MQCNWSHGHFKIHTFALHTFYQCGSIWRYASAGIANAEMSVRTSVRLSFWYLYQNERSWRHDFISDDSSKILVFADSETSWNSKGVVPNEDVKWDWGGYELAILDLYATVSLKRCKIGPWLLLITNRKLHTRFRLVPKSVTLVNLELTWTAIMSSVALHTYISEPLPQKFERR